MLSAILFLSNRRCSAMAAMIGSGSNGTTAAVALAASTSIGVATAAATAGTASARMARRLKGDFDITSSNGL
jgi:predicted NAD/FAD-binding protein